MEELNFCPFKQTSTLCQTAQCALRINGHCAFVDIAVSLAEITASTKDAVIDIGDSLDRIEGALRDMQD